MKRLILIALLCLPFIGHSQNNRPIGSNLTGVVDWSTEYIFTNITKQGREWISHGIAPGSAWSSGVSIPLRNDGYPLEIPYDNSIDPEQGVRMLMLFGKLENLYPGGQYRLIASGQGQIRLLGAASGTFKCPIDTFVSVDSSLGGIIMEIDTSLAINPIHDIKFIMPKYASTYQNEVFNENLLEFVTDFETLRFMDWMSTNNSSVSTWNDRSSTNFYTQTLDNGIAYEYIIDICNQLNKNPWICIPHKADDNYITNLAKLFNDSLKPGLKIYIEYSNEVWNSVFDQNTYALSMGNSLGYTGADWEKGWKFYAKRCSDVFRLFENEISDSTRFVKVIASQAANSWLTNYLIDLFEEPAFNPTLIKANAIAVAPYFGGRVADKIGDAGLIASSTVPQILDSMEADLRQVFEWMKETKDVANNHKLNLIAYEGGQHLVAVNYTYQNDTALTRKLIEANRDKRMQNLYCTYFSYWYDSIDAGLFCNFSSHYLPTKYGSWGTKESYKDTLAPKYLALKNCVFSTNTNNTEVNSSSTNNFYFTIYPNPADNTLNLDLGPHNGRNLKYTLYSTEGMLIKSKALTTRSIDVSKVPTGIYLLVISNKNKTYALNKVVISR